MNAVAVQLRKGSPPLRPAVRCFAIMLFMHCRLGRNVRFKVLITDTNVTPFIIIIFVINTWQLTTHEQDRQDWLNTYSGPSKKEKKTVSRPHIHVHV